MKKISDVLLFISALLIFGCGDMKKDLSEGLHESLTGQKLSFIPYNDSIVGLQAKVVKAIDKFNKATSSDNDSLMNLALEIYKQEINDALDKINSMRPFEGDDRFREAGVELFKYYRSLADTHYPEMIRIYTNDSTMTPDEDKIKINDMEEKSNQMERKLVDNFLTIQQKFAEKYNTPLGKRK